MEIPNYSVGLEPVLGFDLALIVILLLLIKKRKDICSKLLAVYYYTFDSIKRIIYEKDKGPNIKGWGKILIEFNSQRWSLRITFSR